MIQCWFWFLIFHGLNLLLHRFNGLIQLLNRLLLLLNFLLEATALCLDLLLDHELQQLSLNGLQRLWQLLIQLVDLLLLRQRLLLNLNNLRVHINYFSQILK